MASTKDAPGKRDETGVGGRPAPDGEGFSLSDLHMLVWRASNAQRMAAQQLMGPLGLGPGQPKLLSYLAVYGSATQRELASFFEIGPASVCRMLDSLERGGFVRTTRNPSDRRTKLTELTDRGHEAVAAWDQCCRRVDDAMTAGFSEGERELLAVLLDRAHDNLAGLARDLCDAAPAGGTTDDE